MREPRTASAAKRDDRARVLYAITRADLGGAQKHLLWLIDAARIRYRPLVLVGEFGYLTDELEARNIEYRCVPNLKRELSPLDDWNAFRAIRREIPRFRPRLVHLHSFKASTLGRLAAIGSGVPVLVTAHGWTFTDGNPAIRRIIGLSVERLLARACTRIIVVCRRDRDAAVTYRVAPADKVVMIHNGVPDVRKAPPSSLPRRSRPRLINVGRICQQKNQVELASLLADSTDEVEMHFVGDGPERHNLERQIELSGLTGRVFIESNNRDPQERLNDSDVYVSWSRWEGLSLSIIEALRSGLPIVATNVGGSDELVSHGVNGYLLNQGDRRAFATAIQALANDPDLRTRMGRASRCRYLQRFTIERSTARTLELYAELVDPIASPATGPA